MQTHEAGGAQQQPRRTGSEVGPPCQVAGPCCPHRRPHGGPCGPTALLPFPCVRRPLDHVHAGLATSTRSGRGGAHGLAAAVLGVPGPCVTSARALGRGSHTRCDGGPAAQPGRPVCPQAVVVASRPRLFPPLSPSSALSLAQNRPSECLPRPRSAFATSPGPREEPTRAPAVPYRRPELSRSPRGACAGSPLLTSSHAH